MIRAASAPATPLVAVVIIFHQAERFLAEAIDSVIGQTESNWELVLVDDGSSDGSTAIAESYAARDPARIRYLEHKDHRQLGMAASRKAGMLAARGKYIAFLDADDVYLPRRLEHHIGVLEQLAGPAVVIGSELYWHSWKCNDATRDELPQDQVQVMGVTPGVLFRPPDLLTLLLTPGRAWAPGICSVTFHSAALDNMPAVPESFGGHAEDLCLVAALLARWPTVVTNECLAKYRQHPSSLTAIARAKGEYDIHGNHRDDYRYLYWLRGLLQAQGLSTAELESALRRNLLPAEHPCLAWLMALPRATLRSLTQALLRLVRRAVPGTVVEAALTPLRNVRAAVRRAHIRRAEAKVHTEVIH